LFKYMVSFSRYFTVCITYQPPLVDTLFHIYNFQCLYLKPNVSDVTLSLVLNTDIVEGVACLEKITAVVTFLNYCWEFESCKSGFGVYSRTLNGVCNAF
jgi:hypothetical protein